MTDWGKDIFNPEHHALELIASYERDELLERGETTAVTLVEIARKALGREAGPIAPQDTERG